MIEGRLSSCVSSCACCLEGLGQGNAKSTLCAANKALWLAPKATIKGLVLTYIEHWQLTKICGSGSVYAPFTP
jgi:hypothetical protein